MGKYTFPYLGVLLFGKGCEGHCLCMWLNKLEGLQAAGQRWSVFVCFYSPFSSQTLSLFSLGQTAVYSAAPDLPVSSHFCPPLCPHQCACERRDLCNFTWQALLECLVARPAVLTGLDELLTGSVFKLDRPLEGVESHRASACNYPIESNAAPSFHLLLSLLKMLRRELVVISTHDSLIMSLPSSRNTAQRRDAAGGLGVNVCVCVYGGCPVPTGWPYRYRPRPL